MKQEGIVKYLINVIITNTINATNMELKDKTILNNHNKKKFWAKVYKARDKLINMYKSYETASIEPKQYDVEYRNTN